MDAQQTPTLPPAPETPALFTPDATFRNRASWPSSPDQAASLHLLCRRQLTLPALFNPNSMSPSTGCPCHRAASSSGSGGFLLLLCFSRSVVSDSLRPHGPQHTRPPCPSPTPRVHPNPCPLSQRCHPAISSSVTLLLPPSIFPSIRIFASESVLRIRWPKYWSFSFSISPSSEHPGLISFRMDWLDLLAFKGTLKSLPPAPQFESINPVFTHCWFHL